MTLIADLFPKLRILENVVRYMSKKSRFKGPFDTQHGKRFQIRTPLSQTQNTFSELFVPFSKSTLNFDHSKKKDDPHS